MEDEAPVIYGLEFQARCLTAQTAETDRIRFLVGTQSLRSENQVHHIDFDDENNVINKNVFLHREGEVWHISAATFDSSLLATCYNKTSDTKSELKAAIWRLPDDVDPSSPADDHSSSHTPLNLMCHLDSSDHDVKGILWHPTGDGQTVLGVSEDRVIIWDLNVASSTAAQTDAITLESKGQPRLTCGRWNPHHNCAQIATANEATIRGWDLRTKQQTFQMEGAHGQLVRDLDFNPNRQYYLASCGDDCRVKFWDTRNCSEPLKVLCDHSHWVWSVRYNHFHDQLVLTSSSDSRVVLMLVWSVRYNHFHDQLVLTSSSDSRVVLNNVLTLSSEPYGHLVEKDDDSDSDSLQERPQEPPTDGVIATYEEHEDSVYAVDWSTADPWVFASLSYDGRLVINRVPRAEKYKILL
ncbi:hypothetical protein ACOMHN_055951 [Nucella lapillus]